MTTTERDYMPAAGSDRLLALYDPFTRLLGVESAHRLLIEQAAIRPNQRVLEIGCGTGNLALLAQRLCPGAEVTGTDPDPRALERAGRKAAQGKAPVRFERAYAQQLPYPDGSFDRVLSALMFHHLPADARLPTLREAHRVLRPGGTFHLMDFSGSGRGLHGLLAHLFHAAHGAQHGAHDAADPLEQLMRAAGFADPAEVARRGTLAGRVAYYRAAKDGSGA